MNGFRNYLEKTKEIGYVNSFSHSVAFISGLPNLKLEETIITESGKEGIVQGLKGGLAEVLMVDIKDLKVGERAARTGKMFEIGICQELLGRIVNPLLKPIDGLGPIIGEKEWRQIKNVAPSVIERSEIKEPLETGVMIVDLLVPIALGQRELVIGDAKTGKTTFLLQTITSQAKKGIVCVYVGIGKKDVAIKWVEEYLKKQGVFEKVIIIHTTPDDSPTLIYLAPYCGMTVAEYFRDKGKKVLIVFDDLTTHAKVWREISLLLKRMPGRDSYPGDIFYQQASLLERAGNIKRNEKEMSITALPVAETLENDLSGFIQTNLMAMTDGHIFFDIYEFRKGKRPAINAFLSVTRVGNQTKSLVEREISVWVKKKLVEYQRVLELIQFGTELLAETQKKIEIGQRIELLFNQSSEILIPRELQLILVGLLISGFWDNKSQREMKIEIEKILESQKKGKIIKLREKIENIKSLEHLQFLIKEMIPDVEKIIK